MVTIPKKTKNIPIGSKKGEWEILAYAGVKGRGGNSYWLCRCSCGNEKEVCGTLLRKGTSSKCHICSGRINGRKGLDSMSRKHLYFVRCGPYIKIGSSNNVTRRFTNLQGYCPYPMLLVKVIENEGKKEPELHQKFRAAHHQGEWFLEEQCEGLADIIGGACEVQW